MLKRSHVAVALLGAVLLAAPSAATAEEAPPAPPDGKTPSDVAATDTTAQLRQESRVRDDVLHVDERERPQRAGHNDDLDSAERLVRLGTSRQNHDALVTGTLADLVPPTAPIGPFAEDDGAIPLANPTGLTAARAMVRATAEIGDGPHGTSEGDGSGDFDFYLVEDATAGQQLTVDVDAASIGSGLDSFVAVIDASGIIAFNDDAPGFDSFLQVNVPADGDYLVAVSAFGSLPSNPFDSGSGSGATTEGPYELTLSYEFAEDVDVYRVDLRAGDVLGAVATGEAETIEIFDPAGQPVMGSGRDLSAFYPDASPLRVAGNATADHVAAVDGPHFVRVSRGAGGYELDLRLRRPGLESAGEGERQVLLLDFDGAFVDPSTFGADSGELSPLADFLAGWGLGPEHEDAVIDSIVATFAENLRDDPHDRGSNEAFDVDIRTSRDEDLWGQPNVTRIVIGGTREELGLNTFGIAESVDPGNFAREETGVVLLDQASAPAGTVPRTINDFVTPGVDMVALVGRGIGFVASHEAGHLLGNWHTQPNNGVVSIMDTFDITQLGLGPDFVFGTADDVDVDFVVDQLTEGHVGAQDTLNRMAFALSSPVAPRR
jgi:hypothetical protein